MLPLSIHCFEVRRKHSHTLYIELSDTRIALFGIQNRFRIRIRTYKPQQLPSLHTYLQLYHKV